MAASFAQVSAMPVVTGSGNPAPVSAIPVVVVSDGSVPISPELAQPVIDVTANATFPRALKVAPIPIVYASGTSGVAQVDPIPIFVTGATIPAGFPSPGITGPTAGTVFTNSSGGLITTANNQVIQNLIHDGYISVRHSNVTIQDCIITQLNSIYGITGSGVSTGLKVLRCRIGSSSNGQGLSGIDIYQQDNTEIAFCDISNVENGITLTTSVVNIHDNYIHDLSRGGGAADDAAHFDGIQAFPGTFTSWTINHNTIITRDTSGIIMGNHTVATITGPVAITNNLFMHNFPISYGMHIDGVNGLTITGNRISIDNFGAGPGTQRPIYPIDLVSCPTPTVSGNVDHASGTVLVPSIS